MKIENLNLASLKYFLDAVETNSLTKAAGLNHVTRPAISQAILRLEDWLGKKLITHEKKKFELTAEGKIFYRQAKESFANFKKSLEASSNEKGSLSIGCSASLVDQFLLPTFRMLKPIKSLHLVTGTSSSLRHRLEQKEINIAVYVNELNMPYAEGTVIKTGRFVLASKNSELPSSIITTENRPEVIALKTEIYKRKMTNVSFITVESWGLAAKLALELNCACLVPEFILTAGHKVISIKGFNQKYEIVIAHRSEEHLSSLEMKFIELIRKVK